MTGIKIAGQPQVTSLLFFANLAPQLFTIFARDHSARRRHYFGTTVISHPAAVNFGHLDGCQECAIQHNSELDKDLDACALVSNLTSIAVGRIRSVKLQAI